MVPPDADVGRPRPTVPDDVLELLRPGDRAPEPAGEHVPQCPHSWYDAQDEIGLDPPWLCRRAGGHDGQHIAFAEGCAHVAAVLPGDA